MEFKDFIINMIEKKKKRIEIELDIDIDNLISHQ